MNNTLKLAEIFGDHMVLQRDYSIRFFGTGHGVVEVTLNGASSRICSTEEHWLLELPAMPAGGPYKVQIQFNDDIKIINDVYIGDVWLAGGQSNMEFPLREAQYTEDDLTEDSLIRYYSSTPSNEGNRQWVLRGKETTLDFSAIGGHFARRMREEYNIPIGIIGCNRGATCIETWIDKTYLLGTSLELPTEQRFQDAVIYDDNQYGALYDRMVSRLIPYSMKGVLWYQGESNRGPHDGKIYGALLEQLINCWREQFQLPELPFLIVQLTRFGEADTENFQWALIRQQQLEASKKIPHTAMVTTTDLGDNDLIHPLRKKEVADRLFLAARNLVFGEAVEYSGPIPGAAVIENDEICISFTHCQQLIARGALDDIYCRTKDGRLLHSIARTDGKYLYISNPSCGAVTEILAWYRNNALVNLFNEAGFPASTFSMKL